MTVDNAGGAPAAAQNMRERVLEAHRKRLGKIEIIGKVSVSTKEELSTYYTPGVALASTAIKEDKSLSYELTSRANTIAIITDGTRILGLGNIGPEASMPVMEGKALLFKKFGGIDAVPIAIATQDEDEIVNFVKLIEPSFGGINIEDIESPKVFRIVDRLSKALSIPVFHDDRYGTGVVAVAGVINALKLTGKRMTTAKIIINGAGSAGIGIAELLVDFGAGNVIVCDSVGAIYPGRPEGMNPAKERIALITNQSAAKGVLEDVAVGADLLIGVSVNGKFSKEMVSKMAKDPIVFALSNPEPEMSYGDMLAAGARIAATGRSDAPNQINNHIAFPGIMRGLLDSRAKTINSSMLIAASRAIASSVPPRILAQDCIIPSFREAGPKMPARVAAAVVDAANKSGAATLQQDPEEVKKHTLERLKRYASIEKKLHLGEPKT
jgi:malate dehydrogenase (oxaloacetate-decarboxylating)